MSTWQILSGTLPRKPDWRKSLGLHPDFPLFIHKGSGYWAKKVRGKLLYFGKAADDPKGEAALAKWLDEKDDLIAGRTPRQKQEGVNIGDLCDMFIVAKVQAAKDGEITDQTRRDYKRVTDRLVEFFGDKRPAMDLGPDDFQKLRADFTKTNGLVSLSNFINRVRIVFKYGFDAEILPRPVKFGPMFKRPTKKTFRVQRAKSAPKLFTAAEVKQLIEAASPQLKAMILLGVNAGCGNNDCALLEFRHIDLDAGWLDYPRVKTGTKRRCPLWPETVTALREVIKRRKQPANTAHLELVFITKYGDSWAKETDDRPVCKEFGKLVKSQKLVQKGRGFYSLRHTFRTVAGAAKDLEATRAVMGHINSHVEDAYIESLPDDDRLKAVTDHVHAWLYPAEKAAKPKAARKAKTPANDAGLRIVG